MSECIRCEKTFFDYDDSIHTCTPSPKYRAGMNEGELIQQKLNAELQEKYDKALAFITKLLPYQDHEYPMSSLGFDAEKLLKELGYE